MISATFIKLNQLLKREHKYFLHSIFNAILPLFLFLYKLLKKFNNFIFRAVVFNASKTFFLGEFNSNNNKYLLLLDQNDKLFYN